MSSRGRTKAALYEKLQLLRSVTNSSAVIPYPFKHLLSGLSFSSLIYFYLCIDFPSAYENKTYTSFRVSLNGFKTSSFIPFIDILISEIHLLLASMVKAYINTHPIPQHGSNNPSYKFLMKLCVCSTAKPQL